MSYPVTVNFETSGSVELPFNVTIVPVARVELITIVYEGVVPA